MSKKKGFGMHKDSVDAQTTMELLCINVFAFVLRYPVLLTLFKKVSLHSTIPDEFEGEIFWIGRISCRIDRRLSGISQIVFQNAAD